MKEILRIPYPPTAAGKKAWSKQYGLNAYYAGKHWSKRKADADFWHQLVRFEARRQGLRKTPFPGPVALTFTWNDRLDLSNHAVMAKMIEDALKGVLIQDDSRRWVREITHKWHDADYIKIEVEEWE